MIPAHSIRRGRSLLNRPRFQTSDFKAADYSGGLFRWLGFTEA
jgi:hypothetical protein